MKNYCSISLTLLLLYVLLVTPGDVSANDDRETHPPLYGFKCRFPEKLSGKWTQSTVSNPAWALKMRINRMHIHLMDKKFRCIDQHRDLLLVKEEKGGTGLTCLGVRQNVDPNTMDVIVRKHYPEPADVRIDWRDECNDRPDPDMTTISFTRDTHT